MGKDSPEEQKKSFCSKDKEDAKHEKNDEDHPELYKIFYKNHDDVKQMNHRMDTE